MAAFGVHRIDVTIVAAEVDDAVAPDRRGDDAMTDREFPFDAM
jgi:hypothetical protein